MESRKLEIHLFSFIHIHEQRLNDSCNKNNSFIYSGKEFLLRMKCDKIKDELVSDLKIYIDITNKLPLQLESKLMIIPNTYTVN